MVIYLSAAAVPAGTEIMRNESKMTLGKVHVPRYGHATPRLNRHSVVIDEQQRLPQKLWANI